jgi:hypothetical protein
MMLHFRLLDFLKVSGFPAKRIFIAWDQNQQPLTM